MAEKEKTSHKSKSAKYEALKKTVKEREEENTSRLFLFNTGDDWYKMSGNSLLIFTYKIAPKIPLKPNILPDTDYTKTIFDEGLISFHGIEALKKRLEKVDVLKEIKKSNDLVVFELNFSVTEKQLKEFKELLKEDQERVVSILKPEIVLAPMLYTKMRHILKRTFEITRKMPTYSRQMFGEKMLFFAKEIVSTYLLMNKDQISEKKGWLDISKMTEKLQVEMAVAVELKVLDQNSAVSVGGELIEMKKMLKKELKRRNVIEN